MNRSDPLYRLHFLPASTKLDGRRRLCIFTPVCVFVCLLGLLEKLWMDLDLEREYP